MQSASESCDPHIVADYLSGSLDESKRQSFEEHLDSCDVCQRALQDQAVGEAEWWSKPAEFLTTDELDHRLAELSDAGLGATLAEHMSDTIVHDGLQRVIDLLNPTEQANSLGQLDHYEIVQAIGFGGMAVVLKGQETTLDRHVAIKVLAPHLASSISARERFAREARSAAAVTHPNVIEIYSVSEFKNLPYLVMPFVSGGSLQQHLNESGPFSIEATLEIGQQVASGLAAAQDKGLIHRDIKPSNILFESDKKRIVITDFGLARAADDASITQTGILAGTPHFMSPEQARGDAIDTRSDLFSLGSLLFTLCSGKVPFEAEGSFGVLRRITDHPAPRLREATPTAPIWMENLVSRLHKRSPDERFQSARDVAGWLSDCLASVRDSTKPIPTILLPTNAPWYSSRIAVAVGLIAALAFALFAMSQGSDRGKSNDESSIVSPPEDDALTIKPVPNSMDWPADEKLVSLTGRFVMEGALPEIIWEEPSRDRKIYTKPIGDESLIVNGDNAGIANVFVWLSKADLDGANLPIEGKTAISPVRYEGGRLHPHAITMQRSQLLLLGNRDPVRHIVSVGSTDNFVIGAGEEFQYRFGSSLSEPQRMSCQHPWFDCFVLVQDHQFATVSGMTGEFRIDDIPRGTWAVHFWHELPGHINQVVDERGFVLAWPKGVRKVNFDRPKLKLGELVPDLERNDEY